MHIEFNLPVAFSYIGQRSVNQDALYPPVNQTADDQLFIVCDGIGGADKGEIASQLLSEGIANYAAAMGNPVFDIVHLQAALDQVYADYTDYLQAHPLVSRMGSTLAMIQFHHRGVSVAHIGDSRIYQVRAGKIIFQTKDHKQVNDMVEAGIITELQARTHPWRNRLSRAVVVSVDANPQTTTRATPDLSVLTDVLAGDYFFLCTDGVLEQVDEQMLEQILGEQASNESKLTSIIALCDGQTKDNYSAYLIGIRHVTQHESVRESAIIS